MWQLVTVYTPAAEFGVLQSAPTGGDLPGKVVGMGEKISVLVSCRMHSSCHYKPTNEQSIEFIINVITNQFEYN